MNDLKVKLDKGERLLDRLLEDGVDIAHDCGGVLACSSCRVLVLEGLERFDTASEDELDLLDRADSAAPGSRLACQVSGAGELIVRVPRGEAPFHKLMRPVSMSERAGETFCITTR